VRSVCCLAWNGQPPTGGPLPQGITLEVVDSDRDAAELYETDSLAFSENPDYHPAPLEAFCDEHLSTRDLHHPSSCTARLRKRPVGFVLCRKTDSLGYIDLLAVIPAFRRQGIGRALLLHALRTLAGEGATEVRLDVASDNPRALRLYGSVGLRVLHEVMVFEKASERTAVVYRA
jgi:ribosomal protein S18 acetylase RimI-like enzyme